MADVIKLSPSKLGSFLQCPACFWRDYHKKMPPSFPMPGILIRMDSLTKNYYDSYRNSLPPSLKGLPETLVDKQTADKIRHWLSYKDPNTNAELRGKMDDCLINKKGELVPIDNKTASPKEGELLQLYQIQLDAYAFLLQKNNYKTANYGYLIYYTADSGTPDKGIIFKTETRKLELNPNRIPKILSDAAAVLKQSKPPKNHKDCEMCDWFSHFENE
ncbi:MAG: PD-(D/E)XK nuclease family protein [Candidatus Woesearchaeota archaeon]